MFDRDYARQRAVETLRKASAQMARVSSGLVRYAEQIEGGRSHTDLMAFAANDISNMILNLRLDLFVRYGGEE